MGLTIGFAILVSLAIVLSFILIPWRVHLEMTKDNCKMYGWGNYEKVIGNIIKYNLTRDLNWKNSFFNYGTNSRIHAGIIKFDNKGMLLPLVDYWRLSLWIYKIQKEEGKIELVEW